MAFDRWVGQRSLWMTGLRLGKSIQVIDKLELSLLFSQIGPWAEQRLCRWQGMNLGFLSLWRQGLW